MIFWGFGFSKGVGTFAMVDGLFLILEKNSSIRSILDFLDSSIGSILAFLGSLTQVGSGLLDVSWASLTQVCWGFKIPEVYPTIRICSGKLIRILFTNFSKSSINPSRQMALILGTALSTSKRYSNSPSPEARTTITYWTVQVNKKL